jgi:hypothetical protein
MPNAQRPHVSPHAFRRNFGRLNAFAKSGHRAPHWSRSSPRLYGSKILAPLRVIVVQTSRTILLASPFIQVHGFIIVEKRGAFHCKIRHASEYRLTIYESDIAPHYADRLATKEFLRWPEIQNTVSGVLVTALTVSLVRPWRPIFNDGYQVLSSQA